MRPAPRAGREAPGASLGQTKGKIGFHGGKVEIERPRVRGLDGEELALPSWEAAVRRGLARQMGDEPDADQRLDAQVSNVRFGCPRATFRRPTEPGCRNRRPLAASWRCRRRGMKEWMACRSLRPRSAGDPDRRHSHGRGHDPRGGGWRRRRTATSIRSAWSRARRKMRRPCRRLIDNLVERGLDPAVPTSVHHRRLEGSFQGDPRRRLDATRPIQRCQIHKARNIMERLPKSMHASSAARLTASLGNG